MKPRSEEHTSELQSLRHLVCRLLLEKKKENKHDHRERLQPDSPPPAARARLCRPVGWGGRRHCPPAKNHVDCFLPCTSFFLKDGAPPEISPFPLPAALPI